MAKLKNELTHYRAQTHRVQAEHDRHAQDIERMQKSHERVTAHLDQHVKALTKMIGHQREDIDRLKRKLEDERYDRQRFQRLLDEARQDESRRQFDSEKRTDAILRFKRDIAQLRTDAIRLRDENKAMQRVRNNNENYRRHLNQAAKNNDRHDKRHKAQVAALTARIRVLEAAARQGEESVDATSEKSQHVKASTRRGHKYPTQGYNMKEPGKAM